MRRLMGALTSRAHQLGRGPLLALRAPFAVGAPQGLLRTLTAHSKRPEKPIVVPTGEAATADFGLPDSLTDEELKTFLLEEWEAPKAYTPVRRTLYKLQRNLHVVDIWPLPSLADRHEQKKLLLHAVHRLGAAGNFSPSAVEPGPDEPPLDYHRMKRIHMVRKLLRLDTELLDETEEDAAARQPSRIRKLERLREERRAQRAQSGRPWRDQRRDQRREQQREPVYASRTGLTREQRDRFLDFKEKELDERFTVDYMRRSNMRRGHQRRGGGPPREHGQRGSDSRSAESAREQRERYWRERDQSRG